MSIHVVTKSGVLTGVAVASLLVSAQLFAEERPEVLERIAPIGKVAVEGAAKPAEAAPAAAAESAPAATETAAAPAAEAAPAEEAAPAAAPAAPTGDALAVATTSGCMACHQVETKVVGPAYKEVAAKYKGDAGAVDTLVAKVKAGGVGTWGQIPMPPNAHVSDENIRVVVEWILSM
ncbi:MAG: c-type cytochrome [Candidatus Thiodiazotropha lotti]|uniref:c-type cytochrome n=1 Tax=Candidatus Thiodiazotropha endoloripes TaxID=1818881 RepID=UPI001F1E8B32|nr:c-type cytochrome [Candidatus Thiodiazotropha endoloripes]MCG7899115.1 c-type cytochrome [Candidatus Thiodiazotropha weberae]MCG7993339.1 c-type cytochrome [Candidatus Thiodiazotropha lotti]MCG7903747.1 c-type cytochrome [Candidatus Thiodiazotropha weberae]MCG7998144.1 c-type cytochrome [Candidatus Thiodiazotropha lotti]MCW4185001.1 c-type cytochrome [Candidatus Thiodiazotropha weberae]